jgi:hypothetical protein
VNEGRGEGDEETTQRQGARYVMVECDRKGHEEGLVLTRVTWEKTGSATHLTDKHLRLHI